LTIKLKNKGCPSMKVTGIDIEKSVAGADDLAFSSTRRRRRRQPRTPS